MITTTVVDTEVVVVVVTVAEFRGSDARHARDGDSCKDLWHSQEGSITTDGLKLRNLLSSRVFACMPRCRVALVKTWQISLRL